MAQYTARIQMLHLGKYHKSDRYTFSAESAVQACRRVNAKVNDANESHTILSNGRFTFKLTSLKVVGAGHVGTWKYDPTLPCDDCYRPMFKGHNMRVEH